MTKVFKHLYNAETAGPDEGTAWPISRAELDAIEAKYNQATKVILGPKGDNKKLSQPCVFDGTAKPQSGTSQPNMTFMIPDAPTTPELSTYGALWVYWMRNVCGLGGSYKVFHKSKNKVVKVTRQGLGGGKKPLSFSDWLDKYGARTPAGLRLPEQGVHGSRFKKS